MEKIILTGIFVLLAVSFAWGGVSLYRGAKLRGERAGCACLLCFLASFVCGIFAFQQLPVETMSAFVAALGGFAFWRDYRFFKRAIIVCGVVRKFVPRRVYRYLGTRAVVYLPVVRFEFDGQVRQVTGTVYSRFKPKIGKPMKVGVNPQNIEDARVYQKSNLILTGTIAILGTIFLIRMVYSRLAGI